MFDVCLVFDSHPLRCRFPLIFGQQDQSQITNVFERDGPALQVLSIKVERRLVFR